MPSCILQSIVSYVNARNLLSGLPQLSSCHVTSLCEWEVSRVIKLNFEFYNCDMTMVQIRYKGEGKRVTLVRKFSRPKTRCACRNFIASLKNLKCVLFCASSCLAKTICHVIISYYNSKYIWTANKKFTSPHWKWLIAVSCP